MTGNAPAKQNTFTQDKLDSMKAAIASEENAARLDIRQKETYEILIFYVNLQK